MRERVEALGGHFHLENRPGGARVVAELPLQDA
jgi:signal transduction histidine kinase